MKTSAEIIEYVESMLVQMQRRPECYAGEMSEPGSARALDGVLWVAHCIWADAKGWTGELFNAKQRIEDRNDCNRLPFYESFRVANPEATEAETCDFVLKCWRDIDTELGIPIIPTAADEP